MAFRSIDTSVKRKKTALQRDVQLLRIVHGILQSLYPRFRTLRVKQVKRNLRSKDIVLVLEHEHHVARLTRDRELLRAAFRREAMDVRSVSVERT